MEQSNRDSEFLTPISAQFLKTKEMGLEPWFGEERTWEKELFRGTVRIPET